MASWIWQESAWKRTLAIFVLVRERLDEKRRRRREKRFKQSGKGKKGDAGACVSEPC